MNKPLAYMLCPKTLNDVVGQDHLIGNGKILSNLVKNKKVFSMILYGNPGIGKTSIAKALVNDLGLEYRFLNATVNNKKDFDIVFEEAKMHDGLILIVDEIHRLNKDKQDLLLPCVESGLITLIGLTTSNPYHAINSAIRSRCQIFKLEDLSYDAILKVLKKACKSEYLEGIKISNDALSLISKMSKSDLRYAYNLLEVCYYVNDDHKIDVDVVKNLGNEVSFASDKDGDEYYNCLSGLQKSIRGSDVDASLFYYAKLLESGDLESIERRLSVILYEDIGLANPALGPKLNASINAANFVGLPEARIVLAPIIIEMALSPKSNTATIAIEHAIEDVKTKRLGNIPDCIKSPYIGYLYPHNYKNSIVKQTYLPSGLVNEKYYIPKESSTYEKALKTQKEKIEAIKK